MKEYKKRIHYTVKQKTVLKRNTTKDKPKKRKVIDTADQKNIIICVKVCSLNERLKKEPFPKV